MERITGLSQRIAPNVWMYMCIERVVLQNRWDGLRTVQIESAQELHTLRGRTPRESEAQSS